MSRVEGAVAQRDGLLGGTERGEQDFDVPDLHGTVEVALAGTEVAQCEVRVRVVEIPVPRYERDASGKGLRLAVIELRVGE